MTLYLRQLDRITIGADGRMLRCEVIAAEGIEQPMDCDDLVDNLLFVSTENGAEPREMTIERSIYLGT
jgi:hypothetical protein